MKKFPMQIGIFTMLFVAFLMNSSFTSGDAGSLKVVSRQMSFLAAPDYKELILQFDVVTEKTMPDIRNSIEGADGVFFKGYCEEQRVFMYLVNRDVQPDNSFLDKLLIKGYWFTVKEGSSIQQVQIACGMDPTPTNNSNQGE